MDWVERERQHPRLWVLLLLGGLWLLPTTAWAQLPNLLEMSGQYLPSSEVPDVPPATAQVASYDVAFNVPVPLGPQTFLIPGGAYHVDSVSFDRTPSGFAELGAFHSIEVTLLFVQLLPSDWALSLRVAPGLAGDFREVDGDLFRFSALAMATHSFSDAFVLGGGAIASYNFGQFLPLPTIYVDWKPAALFRLEAFLPAFLEATFSWADRFEFGARAEVTGNAYGVRDGRIKGRWPCLGESIDRPDTPDDETQAQSERCLDSLAYSTGSAGLTVAVRAVETIWFRLYAGHTFFRRFEGFNDGGDAIDGADSLPNEFLFRAEVAWRVPQF